MRYDSQKDPWIGWVFGISSLIMVGAAVMDPSPAISIIAPVFVGFMAWIWFGTYYLITDTHLVARCGPFRQARRLEDIRWVRDTKSPISSPALSMTRLEVNCGNGGFLLVSPADRAAFLRDLKEAAPDVSIRSG